MTTLKVLFNSGAFQTILGYIFLAMVAIAAAYMLFCALYSVAKEIADRKSQQELEYYKRQLDKELEEYKNNIVVETTIDIQIEYGVGYENRHTEHRQHRIRRIS